MRLGQTASVNPNVRVGLGGSLPVQSKLTASDRASTINGPRFPEIQDGEVLDAERMEVPNGVAHRARLQGLIGGQFMRKLSSFGDQQADVLDEVRLTSVFSRLFPSRQDFPVPTLLNPVVLKLAQ
jgi:hypothetical protein